VLAGWGGVTHLSLSLSLSPLSLSLSLASVSLSLSVWVGVFAYVCMSFCGSTVALLAVVFNICGLACLGIQPEYIQSVSAEINPVLNCAVYYWRLSFSV